MKPETEQVTIEEFQLQSVGQTLCKTRESLQLSRVEVANSLKLELRYIEALEGDRYDDLPGLTYIRGYIRSYSGLLKIDPDVLLDRLELEPDKNISIVSKTNLNVPAQSVATPRRGKRSRWLLGILITILVVGLSALYTTFQFLDQPGISIPNVFDLNLIGQEKQMTSDSEEGEESVSSPPTRIEGLAIPVE